MCCLGLLTRVAPEYKWTPVTSIAAAVSCSPAGCTVDANGTNRGGEANQLGSLDCTVQVEQEPAPERQCGASVHDGGSATDF